jgi:hypothetical protein
MSGSKDVHDDCHTGLERKQKKRYSEAFKCMVRVHRVVTVVQPQHEHVTSCEFNLSGIVICLARLGLKAPALAWPELALAFQNHEPGPGCWPWPGPAWLWPKPRLLV